MAELDLFQALDALWTKRPLQEGESPPGPFILHRFLASDRDYAKAARYLQREIREPDMLFQVWRGLLPRHPRGAPRLSYVGPKKPPAAEELVQEMIARLPERREVVEEILSLLLVAGHALDLYHDFGVEPPPGLLQEQSRAAGFVRCDKENAPLSGGLLDY